MFVEIQKENIMRSGGPAWKELIESARWETVQRLGKKEFRSSGDRRQETGDRRHNRHTGENRYPVENTARNHEIRAWQPGGDRLKRRT
jgi:hypothetical protein